MKNSIIRMQNIDHQALIREFGTPLYVYDGDLIIENYKRLTDLIPWPKLKIFYAMKSNYNPGILRILRDNGAYLDTVSPGEITMALKLGFTPDKLLFTANNITDNEMHQVKETGVLINIDSLSRLEKLGSAYPDSAVCIRFNPDVQAGFNPKVMTGGDLTKFGILLDDIEEVKRIVQKHNLTVVGLHEHTGSGIADTGQIFQSIENLLSIVTVENFPDLQFIDFGGGFKVPYKPTDEEIDYLSFGVKLTKLFRRKCKKYGRELEIYFEPGKFVTAKAGTLLVQVTTLKNNKDRLIAGTDSGFPHLVRPMYYEAYHHILNLTNPDDEIKTYDICGNICETGDTFATDYSMSEIREGDILAIQNAGAYCYAMGSTYNLRAMPTEVVLSDGKVISTRKRLTNNQLADMIIGECE